MLIDPNFLRKLSRFKIQLRNLPGDREGKNLGKGKGGVLEFVDYRSYLPGDDIRYIDWNIYSRLDRFVLKQFSREEERQTIVLVDASGSMNIGTPSKLLIALQAGISLAHIALSSGYRVQVGSFTGQDCILSQKFTGIRDIPLIIDTLSKVKASGKADFKNVLLNFKSKSNPCALFLFSDLLCAQEGRAFFHYLVSRGYHIFLFHIMAWEELEFPEYGWATLFDSETGNTKNIFVGDKEIEVYLNELNKFQLEWRNFCISNGIRYFFTQTKTPLEKIVVHDLRKLGWIMVK